MKSKYLIFGLITIIFFILFVNIFSSSSNAQDESYHISIIDTSSKYIKTETYGGNTFFYYDISITLHNSGNVPSDSITVKLRDVDGNYSKQSIINPGEFKTFTFDNHPMWQPGDLTVHFNYYATDRNRRAAHNTGETTLVLNSGNDGVSATSTPGYELLILVIGILFISLIKKEKYLNKK
jgi:hypothetical protein